MFGFGGGEGNNGLLRAPPDDRAIQEDGASGERTPISTGGVVGVAVRFQRESGGGGAA